MTDDLVRQEEGVSRSPELDAHNPAPYPPKAGKRNRDAICAWVRQAHHRSAQTVGRQDWERQVAEVDLFLNGVATHYYDTSERKFKWIEEAADSSIRQLSIDQVQSRYRTLMAIFTQRRPDLRVIPTDRDFYDEIEAKKWEGWLDWNERTNNLALKYHEFWHWQIMSGFAYATADWNGYLGETSDPEWSDTGFEGDVDSTVLNPLLVFPEYSADCWESARYVIVQRVRDVTYIQDQYGVKVDPDHRLEKTAYQKAYREVLQAGDFSRSLSVGGELPREPVAVYDCWVWPCARYPAGRHIIATADKVLEDNEEDGRVFGRKRKLVRADFILPGNRMYPRVPLAAATRINRLVNAVNRKIANHNLKMTPFGVAVPRDALADDFSFDPEQIARIEFDRSKAPNGLQLVQGRGLGAEFYAHLDKLESYLDNSLGITESLLGELPGGQRLSGAALNHLTSMAMSKTTPETDRAEAAWAELAWLRILLAGKFYVTPRPVMFSGHGNAPVATQMDRDSFPKEFVVTVVPGSSRPKTRGQEMMEVMEMTQLGILTPREARRKLTEIDNGPPGEDEEAYIKQQEEIELMLQGIPVEVTFDDNHEAESYHITRFRRSPAGRQLKYGNPFVWQLLEQHAVVHRAAIDQADALAQGQPVAREMAEEPEAAAPSPMAQALG